jgi:hypothetical protein
MNWAGFHALAASIADAGPNDVSLPVFMDQGAKSFTKRKTFLIVTAKRTNLQNRVRTSDDAWQTLFFARVVETAFAAGSIDDRGKETWWILFSRHLTTDDRLNICRGLGNYVMYLGQLIFRKVADPAAEQVA